MYDKYTPRNLILAPRSAGVLLRIADFKEELCCCGCELLVTYDKYAPRNFILAPRSAGVLLRIADFKELSQDVEN